MSTLTSALRGVGTILADGFRVTAVAPDGNVEAFEREHGAFQVGMEFHPELQRETQPRLNELFERLVREASTRSQAA